MSGAAGLSAAKRRRGGNGGCLSTTNTRPPPQRTATPRTHDHHPLDMAQISPMKILENHEIRLNNLDQHLQDIIESFGAQNASSSDESLVFFRDRTIQLETEN